jgi:glycosyltransferase involved in cell wall biosynthesis
VERERFDVVHVDTLELTPYASHLPGKVVLNLHNCESAMMRRRTNQEKGFLRRAFLEGEARALARLERRGYPQFDTVVTVSAHDAAEVQSTEPSAHTHVVENGTDCAYFSPSGDGKPGEVVFAAAYNWYPNANAASYLLTEIWPLVRNLSPQAHLTVAGKQPSATLRRLVEAADRATLAADPADMRPFLRDASVVVCPIREGGGTRLKILDAMAMGKPVVATSIACEGLRVSPGDDILIAEDAAEFARKTQMLLNDLKLRERIGSSARRTVERQYAWEIVGMQLRDAYLCRGECGMRQPGISAAAVRGES